MEGQKLSDHKVVIYGQPEMKTITVKNGEKAGQQLNVISCKAYHPNIVRKEDGTFERKDPTWYRMQYYGKEDAAIVGKFLTDGLALRVTGYVKDVNYQDKEGKTQTAKELTADNIAIEILQKGLKSVVFEKPVPQQTKNQVKTQAQKANPQAEMAR